MSYKETKSTENKLIWVLTIIAMLIASWLFYQANGSIDEDGALYLEVAKRITAGKYQEALQLYNWPFFPWLIAKTHLASGLHILTSAQILQVLFFTTCCWSLLKLVQMLGGDKYAILFAAILLLSSDSITGHALIWILRDQGFWAFYLLSLIAFFKYYQSERHIHATIWQITTLISALFRIESLTLLALLPIAFLYKKNPIKLHLKNLFKSYTLIMLGSVILYYFYLTHPQQSFGRLSELASTLNNLIQNVSYGLKEKSNIIETQILTPFTSDYAPYSIIIILITILIGKIISGSGIIPTALSIIFMKNEKYHINKQLLLILILAVIINTINLTISLMTSFILVNRYVFGISFIMIIFASISCSTLINSSVQSPTSKLKIQHIALIIIISTATLSFYKILSKNDSNNYRKSAVTWLKENSNEGPIFYSDARQRFYANSDWQGRNQNWESEIDTINKQKYYKYLSLVIKNEKKFSQLNTIQNLENYHVIKEFKNTGKSYILILERNH